VERPGVGNLAILGPRLSEDVGRGVMFRNISTKPEEAGSSRTLVEIVLTEANPCDAAELEGGRQRS